MKTKRIAIFIFTCILHLNCWASDESITINIDEITKIEFKAHSVDLPSEEKGQKIEDKLNSACYAIYDKKLYMTPFKIPRIILDSAVITLGGKQIELDVSGIADAWLKGDKINKRFVKVIKDAEFGVTKVSVCFAKGGAYDFFVDWDIYQGKSMRTGITYCGDSYPEWVKEK